MKKVRWLAFVVLLMAPTLPAEAGAAAPGDLDPTFGTGGKVLTPIGASTDAINALAIDAQGRIVVAGSTKASGVYSDYEFAVARYDPDGSLDSSFGGDGVVTTPFGTYSGANAIAIDPQGRIVVAGHADNAEGLGFGLARYNPDGSLDSSFDGDGKVTTPIIDYGPVGRDAALAVAIDPEGRIVAGGYVYGDPSHPTSRTAVLARYNADGSLDGSFGGDGLRGLPLSGYMDYIGSIAVDSQGRVVAAGATGGWARHDFFVARLRLDGEPDPSFGGDGVVTTEFSFYSAARAIGVDAQGRIVAGGFVTNGDGHYYIAVARYRADGSLDGSFGSGGMMTTDFGRSTAALALALDARDRILLGGTVPFDTGIDRDFAIARANRDGGLDGTFGIDGTVTTSFGSDDVVTGLAIDEQGRIVAGGHGWNGVDTDFALARYLGDPSPPGADTIPPALKLSGKSAQELDRTVRVRASCDEACDLEASGDAFVRSGANARGVPRSKTVRVRLKPASASLAAGENGTLVLRLSKKRLGRLERALKASRSNASAKVRVIASDGAGNEDVAKRTVRLRG